MLYISKERPSIYAKKMCQTIMDDGYGHAAKVFMAWHAALSIRDEKGRQKESHVLFYE